MGDLRERCTACNARIRLQDKFCSSCGRPLTDPAQAADAEHPRSAEGERKVVTVLFADVVDSTALISDLDAEEADRILEPTLRYMMHAVNHYGGTVTQTAGDGIMAIFGAPVSHEDHAVRACYAALEIQDALRSFAAEVRREFGSRLQARVGINSGAVVIRTIHQQASAYIDYRAVGLTTHVAAKVQALAGSGRILLTRETATLARGYILTGELEKVTIKGIDSPVEVCELADINPLRRIQARASRGLSRFVGRDREMAVLKRMADEVEAGRGKVVALGGHPGVGKSRVFWEFAHAADVDGWLVLEVGAVSYGKATPYVLELVARYFGITRHDSEARAREKIASKLMTLGEETLLAQVPLLLGALGWGSAEESWSGRAPSERREQLIAALRQALIRESARQPVCLVIEDLHWIDTETQAFLDLMAGSIADASLLILVNFRPEYVAPWRGKPFYTEVMIGPLTVENAGELLDSLLGFNAELRVLKQTLIEATQGNPLFLEEYVRSLIEQGLLAGAAGQWRLTGALSPNFVPQSITGLLASRIDRLQPHIKELLQCAAVIGNDVPHALLAAVGGQSPREVEKGVDELKEAEFLFDKAFFPQPEYSFKHTLTREVAYSSLVRERRKALHAKVATTLVKIASGPLDEQASRVAEHAERSELWPLAVEYLQRAGARAFALYANREATDYFQRALKAHEYLPRNRSTLEQAVDLRFELRNALIALCELGRIRECLEHVEPLIAQLGDVTRAARLASFRCNDHFLAGEQRRALQWGEKGLPLARQSTDRRLEPELLQRVGQCYHLLGEHARGAELVAQSIAATAEQRGRGRFELTVLPPVGNRAWLAVILTEMGNFAQAVAHAKRALEIAEQGRHPLSEVVGWFALGHALRRKGEIDGAIAALERGLALSDRHTLPIWRQRLLSTLGVAYGYSGRLAPAMDLTRQALQGAEAIRLTVDQPLLREHHARVLLLAGERESALLEARRALDQAVEQQNRRDEPWARLLLAQASPDIVAALAELERALSIARAADAKPLRAYCEGLLGLLHERSGNAAAARDCAGLAAELYTSLGMRPVLLEPRAAASATT